MSDLALTLFQLRQSGWTVAVHNDYRLDGEHHTFWLFTRGDRCAKGEGRSDEDALAAVRSEIRRQRVEDERRAMSPGEDPGCVACGALTSDDGSVVTWRCSQCRGEVCRDCALRVPGRPGEVFSETLCSKECWERAGRPDE